ncbi:uncharacterized protein [Clytia hemisphaerica]|uniref:uncharacterized protein n=1 Tax=Clytia hemisphaerica TaxID=252671 RepID=UPI0034D689FD
MFIICLTIFLNVVLKIPVNLRKLIAFLMSLYLVTSIESFTAHERKSLSEIRTRKSFVTWIEELCNQKPVLRQKSGNELVLYHESRDMTDVSAVKKIGDESGNIYVSIEFDFVIDEYAKMVDKALETEEPKVASMTVEKGSKMADKSRGNVSRAESTIYGNEVAISDTDIEFSIDTVNMAVQKGLKMTGSEAFKMVDLKGLQTDGMRGVSLPETRILDSIPVVQEIKKITGSRMDFDNNLSGRTRNFKRDVNKNFTASIDNLKSHVLISSKRNGGNFWLSRSFYIFCAICAMSWPYRWFWQSQVISRSVHIVKKIILHEHV